VSHTKEAMWHLVLSAPILTALIGGAAAAGTTEKTPPPKCLKAEINPFTGRVVCINPAGAPVETPPEDAKLRCWSEARQGNDGAGCLREPGLD
jgi:hypothetical protein